ncbi:hypothetical protein AGMMS49983_07480 [Clostridia bacterium]|nr:hypothetical protein AGMMS49983_07480 [Clostridia bacterium]
MNELLQLLRELHPEVDFESQTNLVDEKILNSFDIITLIASIADSLGVTIPPEEIIPDNFNSTAALYALINRLDD